MGATSWLRAQLRDHPVRFVAVIGAVFTLALINVKLFAAGGPWWRGWADQKAYLESARAFAALDFRPSRHWYPLAYAIAAAPFAAWLPAPFVPINIACYAVAFAGFRRVAHSVGIGSTPAVFVWLATTLIDSRIAKLWVEPWTTTLSAALIWLALGILADLICGKALSKRQAALFGAALILVPLARPADVVVGGVIGLFALKPLARQRSAASAIAGALVVAGTYGALYLKIYGVAWSDYLRLSRDYGLNFADLGWKTSVLLVDPAPWFPNSTGLLREMPWLLIGAAGVALGVVALRDAARKVCLCLLLSSASYAVVLFAYVDLLPTGFWRFNNVHYFKWMMPLFGLGVWLFVAHARQHRGFAASIALTLTAITGFRFEAASSDAKGPAKALVFAVPPGANWNDIYTARSVIVDPNGGQRNYFDYHQILGDGQVVAIALKRPFGSQALWYGPSPPPLVAWPTGSPAVERPLAGSWPRRPMKRFSARLHFGYPCWLPPFGCPQTFAE